MPSADHADHSPVPRINARPSDAFDIASLRHYPGPNPYLDTAALVFDFALTGQPLPLSLTELRARVSGEFPALAGLDGRDDYPGLFAHAVSEVGRLRMYLHMERWSVHPVEDFHRIAVECLHQGTLKAAVYLVWDWFEALSQGKDFDMAGGLAALQESFGGSVYGGPTTYSLLRAARRRGIPVSHLWVEGLTQYGYGSRQVRGAATTFDRDSQLDSDFTTRKDDCKAFLEDLGFPVPAGEVVETLEEAEAVVGRLGYPVVVKPLAGHKGIGVTANIQSPRELAFAFGKALESLPGDDAPLVIVETFISGHDFRLLCVDGKFTAAVKREAASVVGDDRATVLDLIHAENLRPERADTPISPLGKIPVDDALENVLAEQGLSLEAVPAVGQRVVLRKVANLSAGGVSENVTDLVHPDTVAMCNAISQQFRLTCLGIDVLTDDIRRSWRAGNFGIIEINAAPGIFMHLNPARGQPVDVPSRIIETFFADGVEARIPIVTFNRLTRVMLRRILDAVLEVDLGLNPGGACGEAVWLRRDEWPLMPGLNDNIRNLLRHPRLDLLVAECPGAVYAGEGLAFDASDLVVLLEPDEMARDMARHLTGRGVVMIREGLAVEIRRGEAVERLGLAMEDEFTSLYLREIRGLCGG